MSLNSDKKQVFENVGLLRTIAGLPDPKNNLKRFDTFKNKNNKDVFLFIFELLITLVGIEVIKKTISSIVANSTKKLEKEFKTTLKNELFSGVDNNTANSSTISNGFSIPMSSFDSMGYLKISPLSPSGQMIYKGNDFMLFMYNSVLTNPGTFIPYPKTPDIQYKFDSTTNSVVVKNNGSNNYKNFINTIIDSLIFIQTEVIITLIFDEIFGSISKNLNKSREQVKSEVRVDAILNKIEENVEPDNFFKFTKQEDEDIEFQSSIKSDGNNAISIGCGIGVTALPIELFSTEINNLNNNVYSTQLVEDTITTVSNNYIKDSNNGIDQKDVDSVRNNFFKQLMFALKKVLITNTILSPQVKLLMSINDIMKNGGTSQVFNSTEDEIKGRINIISCLVINLKKTLNEELFNLLKTEILKIVAPVATIYAKEGVDKLRNIVKSLIRRK